MDALYVSLVHHLRSFRLELELEVGRETVALVGPSGAGKTSVLRAIAGLLRPERGRIALDGKTWFDAETKVDLPPDRRSVGLVFQEYALFPHMTVAENVAYAGPRRVDDLLELLGITPLRDARPGELSGGERQRVAVARALARDPAVLLLDEPLAALDAHTRARVRAELGDLLGRLGLPTLLVTHDFQDAAALADRVGVLVDGSIVQEGTARSWSRARRARSSPTSPAGTCCGERRDRALRGSRRSISKTAPGSSPPTASKATSAPSSTRGRSRSPARRRPTRPRTTSPGRS